MKKKSIIYIILVICAFFIVQKNVYAEENKVYWNMGNILPSYMACDGTEDCYRTFYRLVTKDLDGVSISDVKKIVFNNTVESNTVITEGYKTSIGDVGVYYSDNTIYIQYAGTLYFNADSRYMFSKMSSLEYITGLEYVNTSEVTNMENMFADCNNLKSIDVSTFETSNVTNMQGMFSGCSSLTELDVSHFNTSNVTKMGSMFYKCSSLTKLDVSHFDTSNVDEFNGMFAELSLKKLDLRSFKTDATDNMNYMFSGSSNLEMIVVSDKWIKPSYGYEMFENCTSLIGMNGTTFSMPDHRYANIDTEETPGYFWSMIPDEIYWAVDGENCNKSSGECTLIMSSNEITGSHFASGLFDREETPGWSNLAKSITSVQIGSENDIIVPTSTSYWFANMPKLTTINVDYLNTSRVTDMSYMFYNTGIEKLNLSSLNTKNVVNMEGLFAASDEDSNISNPVTNINISTWDTSKVTNMKKMFYGCKYVVSLNLPNSFDTSKVTDMSYMFAITSPGIVDFTNFNTSNVTNMEGMFYKATFEELDLSSFNTTNVTNMSKMFNVTKITGSVFDISSFNTSKVTDMSYMFLDFNRRDPQGSSFFPLDVSNFNTSNVTTMKKMFSGCYVREFNLSNFNTSKVTDMSYMFASTYVPYRNGYKLNSFDTSNVTDMSYKFSNSSLVNLDLSSFNTSKVTDMSYMFYRTNFYEQGGIDLNSFNTSMVSNMSHMFDYSKAAYIKVDNFDTSNVTDMSYMFYNLRSESLDDLDLYSFTIPDGCNLTSMFEESRYLKAIISDKDWDGEYTSINMFKNCINLVGMYGTRYNSDKINNEYAKLDSETQNGYFSLRLIKSVSLDKTSTTLLLGNDITLIATINPENTIEDKTLTWTSSNPEVASVDQNGKVTSVDRGTATITVTTSNGKQATCEVTVKDPKVLSITTDKDTYEYAYSVTSFEVTYYIQTQDFDSFNPVSDKEVIIGDESIVKLFINGSPHLTFKLLKPGETTITIRSHGVEKVINVIYHHIEIDGVTLNNSSKTLLKGETLNLEATITPANTTQDKTLTWTSSNPEVASVDQNGIVTAIERGTATITVTTSNEIQATCEVKVIDPKVLSITTAQDEYNVYTNTEYISIGYSIKLQDCDDVSVSITNDNPEVVTLNDNGNPFWVYINNPGVAHITISSEGVQKVITINVSYAPKIYYNNELSDANYKIDFEDGKGIYNRVQSTYCPSDDIYFPGCPVDYNSYLSVIPGTTGEFEIYDYSLKYYNKALVKITKRSNNEDVTNEVLNDNTFVMPNYDINIIVYQVRKMHFAQIITNTKNDNINIHLDSNSNGNRINYDDNETYHFNDYVVFDYAYDDNGNYSNSNIYRITDIKIYKISEKDFESYLSGEGLTNKIDVTDEIGANIECAINQQGRMAWNIDFDFPKYDVIIEPILEYNVFDLNIVKNDELYSTNYSHNTETIVDFTNSAIGGEHVYLTFTPKDVYESKGVRVIDSNGNEIEHTYTYYGLAAAVSFTMPYSDVTVEPIVDRKIYTLPFYDMDDEYTVSSYWKGYRVTLDYVGPERTTDPVFNVYRTSDNKKVNDLVEFDGKSFIMPDYEVVVKISSGPVSLSKPQVSITQSNNTIWLEYDKQIDADRYEIYRSENNKTWKKIDSVSTDTYKNKSLTYGKTYYYKLKACNENECSKYSEVVSKKIKPNKTVLNIKSAGTNNVKLYWEKVSVTGYQIARSTDNKKWTNIKTITKSSTLELNDKSLKANKTYYYKIRAYKTVSGKKIYGSWSNVVSTKTAPNKPTFEVKLKDYNEMNLVIGYSKGTSIYRVERSLDGKEYTLFEELPKEGTLVDSEHEVGKTYYYRLRACNSENRCSSWVYKELKQTPKTPKLTLTTSSKKVTATLGSVNGANGYKLYMATSKNGKYSMVHEFTSEDELLEYTAKTKKGYTYYFKVRSYMIEDESKVYSPYSSIKSIKSK